MVADYTVFADTPCRYVVDAQRFYVRRVRRDDAVC